MQQPNDVFRSSILEGEDKKDAIDEEQPGGAPESRKKSFFSIATTAKWMASGSKPNKQKTKKTREELKAEKIAAALARSNRVHVTASQLKREKERKLQEETVQMMKDYKDRAKPATIRGALQLAAKKAKIQAALARASASKESLKVIVDSDPAAPVPNQPASPEDHQRKLDTLHLQNQAHAEEAKKKAERQKKIDEAYASGEGGHSSPKLLPMLSIKVPSLRQKGSPSEKFDRGSPGSPASPERKQHEPRATKTAAVAAALHRSASTKKATVEIRKREAAEEEKARKKEVQKELEQSREAVRAKSKKEAETATTKNSKVAAALERVEASKAGVATSALGASTQTSNSNSRSRAVAGPAVGKPKRSGPSLATTKAPRSADQSATRLKKLGVVPGEGTAI